MKKFFTFIAAVLMCAGMYAQEPEVKSVVLDFTDANWGITTVYDKTEKSYTNGDYTITFSASSNGHKVMTKSKEDPSPTGIIFGKKNATLTLPEVDFAVSKIVVTGLSGASGKVTTNIYVGEEAVSLEKTGSKDVNTFVITPEKRAAGNVFVLKITNDNNAQAAKIELFEDQGEPIPTVDTVSVSDARKLIDASDSNPHFVRGVAAGSPFIFGSAEFKGNIVLWLTDEKNAKDSLEAYYIAGKDNKPWESLAAAKDEIQSGDTVLVYATKLKKYNSTYEIDPGYYVEMLGKYQEDPSIKYDTLTVAQAIEAADALADNASSEKKVFVEGLTDHVQAYDVMYGNQIFFMYDEGAEGQDSVFQAYRSTPKKDGKAYPVLKGDKVRAFGFLKKYIDTKNGNAKMLEIVEPTVEFLEEVEGDRTIVIPTIDTITVARALEIGKALTGSQLVTKENYCIEGYVSHIQEPYTEQYGNETFWITDTKGDRTMDKNVAFEVYHGKPSTGAEIGLQAKIRIVCKIKNYNGTIENDGQNITFEVLEQGVPEEVKKVSVEEAVAIGKALATGAETLDRYEITGYVSQIAELYHPDKKTELFWISDNKGSRAESSEDNAFYVFNGRPDNQQELGLDAKVTIVTTIKNYNGTIENNSAIDVEVLEQGSIEADTLSVKEALVKGKELSGKSANFCVVEGYIASVSKKYDASYGNMSFYMHDKFDKTRGDFQCYNAKVAKKDTAYFKQGSYVRVLGRMENGSHGIQLTQGCRAFTAQAPKLDTTFVTVAEAVEIGNALAVNEESDVYYAVFGYFAYGSVQYDETAGTQTFGISDDEEYDMDTSLSLYAVNAMIASPGADYGDKVYVVGWISKSKDEDGEFISIENGNAYVNEIPQPTGFEQIEMTEKARKVLINGGIYIIRDKKMYNLQGARVK